MLPTDPSPDDRSPRNARSRILCCCLASLLVLAAVPASALPPPPVTEGRPFHSEDRLVVAYVFGWYTATTGQTLGVWHPLEGRAEWDGSVAFWKRQVKDMMDANIDLIYVHVIYIFTEERANLFRALQELRKQGYQVPQIAPWFGPAFTFHPGHLGPIDLCDPSDRDLFMDQVEGFYLSYYAVDPSAAPFLATMDGKPMLAMWSWGTRVSNPQCLPRATFESELFARLGPGFADGVYFASIAPPNGFDWSDEYNRAFVGYTGGYSLVNAHLAVLKPGQWDLLDRFLARQGGAGFSAGWDELLATPGLRQIRIESWNEYTEGTGIFEGDPSQAYWQEDGYIFHPDTWGPTPRLFIDLTAEKATVFNDVPELDAVLPHADPLPSTLELGETASVQVVARNTGDTAWRGDAGFSLMLDWGDGFAEVFPLDDGQHEIDQRDDPLFAGQGGYGGVFRGRPIVLTVEVAAPTISGLYRPRWSMARDGVPFGAASEQVVQVGEASACATPVVTGTVAATLSLGAYGNNYFCGDLGDPARTADFVCRQLGYRGALSHTTAPEPPGAFCAYKTEADTPNFGLSGNWGHGSRVITETRCAPSSCGIAVFPTTVHSTLGIGAYGDNGFCGDLGDPGRTADFVCTRKGFDRTLGYRTGPEVSSNFCAYKTEADSPHFGLSGNWGHGDEELVEVRCLGGGRETRRALRAQR